MLLRVSWLLVLPQVVSAAAPAVQPSPPANTLPVQQAVAEAIEHNLGLLADRFNLTIDEARLVTARRRPNPVLSVEGDHLDWLGTHYDKMNNAGPQEYSVRTDFVLENGSKRARRIDVAEQQRSVGQCGQLSGALPAIDLGRLMDAGSIFVTKYGPRAGR